MAQPPAPPGTTPLERSGSFSVKTLLVEVTAGPDAGLHVEAPEDRVTVGTARANDLVLSDPTVSRFHLELSNEKAGIWVRDLGSRNGTLAADVFIECARIPVGTELFVGRSRLRVDDGAERKVDGHDAPVLVDMLGDDRSMRRLMGTIQRVAGTDKPCLITGDSGTGKELTARALHAQSGRAGRPFVVVDCGALTPSLVASALFGHERGASAGTEQRRAGAFERAHGGTLLLDDVGELSLDLQRQLLGVLERQRFLPVGGSQEHEADVRVIAATSRDLRGEVNRGAFREDLYHRLAVVTLDVPPLRDRLGDVPLLAEHFFREAGGSQPFDSVFKPAVLEQMARHGWPGNVRELRHFVEAMVVMGELPEQTAVTPGSLGLALPAELLEKSYAQARGEVLSAFEQRYLSHLLTGARGNVSGAARRASMDRSYLIKLLEKHGLK
ncbi:MAG: sigma 54-dependent Fis family transcriptional regulator [Myxococcales bacterium]|nr:MAG: sigma 54-dependent Fis family transcriptional regulator [Myxococcales bacterium]